MVEKCVELAVKAGKKRWSDQTQYLHYRHGAHGEEVHYTIPVVENFHYAYALMRTHQADQVQKAQLLLRRLFAFQTSKTFPHYLHEYPNHFDRLISMRLIPVLSAIQKNYRHVMPSELQTHLDHVLHELSQDLEKELIKDSPSWFPSVKGAAALTSQGSSFGASLLQELLLDPDTSCLENPQILGELYLALQPLYPSLSKSPSCFIWEAIDANWDAKCQRYIGPYSCGFQNGLEPETTLLDLIMAEKVGSYPKSVLTDHIVHLQGALIQKIDEPEVGEKSAAYQVAAVGTAFPKSNQKAFHPFRLTWGDPTRFHSFVSQGRDCIKAQVEEHEILLQFPLTEDEPGEDREKQREVQFFFDVQDLEVKIGERAATAFELEDQVTLDFKKMSLKVTFELLEGEGTFMGHLARGNRPSQLALKGSQRYESYDWTLFLRTLKRTPQAKIGVKIQAIPK